MVSIHVVSSPDFFSEAGCGQDEFLGWRILGVGVDAEGLAVCTPVSPVFVSRGFIIVHNAIFDRRPSSSEITDVEMLLLRKHSHQFCLCDRGE